jgi:hypothetical protein
MREDRVFVKLLITRKSYRSPVRKRNRHQQDLIKFRWRPEHFCASVEKAAKRGQVSWLREIDVLITVARPRGIHTRFPILPDVGHPNAWLKDQFRLNGAHTITRSRRESTCVPFVLFCGKMQIT